MAIFKQCMRHESLRTSNIISHLQLPNIYQILSNVTLQSEERSTEYLITETLAKAQDMASQYEQKATDETNKLIHRSQYGKGIPDFQTIIQLISNREDNIRQRTEYNTTQKILQLSSSATTH